MVNKKKSIPPKEGERVILRGMEEVMHSSMIPYAEHVIMERALPLSRGRAEASTAAGYYIPCWNLA